MWTFLACLCVCKCGGGGGGQNGLFVMGGISEINCFRGLTTWFGLK